MLAQFVHDVVPYISLSPEIKDQVISQLTNPIPNAQSSSENGRLEQALNNLRKQHLWGDVNDEEYRQQKLFIERQLNAFRNTSEAQNVVNLTRACELMSELVNVFSHEGVTDVQREAFIKEVFASVRLDGNKLIAIEPKAVYKPIFTAILNRGVLSGRGERI